MQRRDARDQRQRGDDADGPACRRGHPRVPGGAAGPRGASEGHRPRGYSLNPRNGCELATRPGRCTSRPGPGPVRPARRWIRGTPTAGVFSPSRTGPACGPRYSADAVTNPASAVISRRASSRSRCGLSSGSSADSPSFSAAALISITADRVITSTAGISASSRAGGSAAVQRCGSSVMPARLACATVPAYARDSKWSPTPTAGHTGQRSGHRHLDACPGRLLGPALSRAFLFIEQMLMVWAPQRTT